MDAQPVSMAISPIKILPLRFAFYVCIIHSVTEFWIISKKILCSAKFFVDFVIIIIIIIKLCVCVCEGNLLGLHLELFMSASYCSFIHVFRF